MGVDYKVYGSLKLKADVRVRELIDKLKAKLVGEDWHDPDEEIVSVEGPVGNIVVVDVNFNNYGSSWLPSTVQEILDELEPFMVEPSKLEFMEGVEDWEKWYGPAEMMPKAKSLEAMEKISELLPLLTEDHFNHLRAFLHTRVIAKPEDVRAWRQRWEKQ